MAMSDVVRSYKQRKLDAIVAYQNKVKKMTDEKSIDEERNKLILLIEKLDKDVELEEFRQRVFRELNP